MDLEAKSGEGAFQWNRGGWFGSQVGATLWLVLLGALLVARSESVGGWMIVLGLLPNLIGVVLWRMRRSLPPYPAVQGLIASCGVCALLAMLCMRNSGQAAAEWGLPAPWFLLIYPALMLAFHLQEQQARRSSD